MNFLHIHVGWRFQQPL